MSVVTFISHDGEKHEAPLEDGESLMQIAVSNMVPGIDGDCGGECACATCHVYVEDAWRDKAGGRTDTEETMLSFAAATKDSSRLCCQITMSAELDGIVVHTPDGQH